MGFCAQFGSYSLMDLSSNKLINVEPIAVSKQYEINLCWPAITIELYNYYHFFICRTRLTIFCLFLNNMCMFTNIHLQIDTIRDIMCRK